MAVRIHAEAPLPQKPYPLPEHERLWHAVAAMTFAWANVENGAVMLLNSALRSDESGMAPAIFFAPAHLDSRLAILNRVMEVFASNHRSSAALIWQGWETCLSGLRKQKEVRNKVAHGQITHLAINGKTYVRLTGPIFDTHKSRIGLANKQVPGMSAHDIEKSVEAVLASINIMHLLGNAVQAVHKADAATLRQTLPAIESYLKNQPRK